MVMPVPHIRNHIPEGNDFADIVLHNSAFLCIPRSIRLSSFILPHKRLINKYYEYFSPFLLAFSKVFIVILPRLKDLLTEWYSIKYYPPVFHTEWNTTFHFNTTLGYCFHTAATFIQHSLIMTDIPAFKKALSAEADVRLIKFASSLIPDLKYPMLGVRIPVLRNMAKKIARQEDWREVCTELSRSQTYEERMLAGLIPG